MTEESSVPAIAARIAGARETPSKLESQWLLGATLAAITGSEAARLRVGRYVLVRELGRGGQGTVWEAEDPTMRRPVALKFVHESSGRGKPGWLQGEARAMAHLQHENIVEVFDVGEHDGLPYVVLERLTGQTLEQYARGHRSLSALLPVFLAAGRGLAAAHRAGVVHGDFKPSNVMVCDDGSVKVLDFGLARWSRHPDPSGPVGGTPAFMAPEQRLGNAPDERSDQYSFCASLRDLLSGAHPTDTPSGSRVPRSITNALARGLQPDPDERWGSMDALLTALTRNRRRRLMLLGGGATLGACLLAGTLAPSSDGPQCREARSNRLGVWNPVRKEKLSSAFAGATSAIDNPGMGVRTWARTSDALDRYTQSWEQEFAHQCDVSDSETRTCLLDQLQRLDALLGIWESADARAVELATGASAALPNPKFCGDALSSPALEHDNDIQAELATVSALRDAGRIQEATERAETLVLRSESASPSSRASALLLSGKLLRYSDPRRAAERLETATLIASAAGQDRLLAEAAASLAFVHATFLLDPAAAERSSRLAAAALSRLGGDTRLQALLDSAEADIAVGKGDLEAAVRIQEASWKRIESSGMAASFKTRVLYNLASTRLDVGDARSVRIAITELQRVLELDAATLGASHPTNAETHITLGVAYEFSEDWERATAHWTRALELVNAAARPNEAVRAVSLTNLAAASAHNGDFTTAMESLEQVYAIQLATLGIEHPDTARVAGSLGTLAHDSGDLQTAIRWRTEALSLYRNAFDDGHPRLAQPTLRLARTWLERGDELLAGQQPDQARLAFERAASFGAGEVDAVVRERLATLAPPT